MFNYLQKTQMCLICGKVFVSTPTDNRGEILYSQHWKISKNIQRVFDESKDVHDSKRSDDIVNKFLKVTGNDKANMVMLLDCLCRYDCKDKELLEDVCGKLQEKIEEKSKGE